MANRALAEINAPRNLLLRPVSYSVTYPFQNVMDL
jgi:hypothetical protein